MSTKTCVTGNAFNNCFEMMDIALEFMFSAIHVLISVCVLDELKDLHIFTYMYTVLVKVLIIY